MATHPSKSPTTTGTVQGLYTTVQLQVPANRIFSLPPPFLSFSHFSPYDKRKSFKVKEKYFVSRKFEQSYLFLLKSLNSTILFYMGDNIHFADILKNMKSFTLKIKIFCPLKNQKSSLFLYKSWFSTISLNIGQDIHFTDTLIQYEIFHIKIRSFCS